VVPRSKGGKLIWQNTVSACRTCNVKKGSLLPEELPRVGMKLRQTPRTPTFFELKSKAKHFIVQHVHPDWKDYL
jgi:hypothetical protein